MLLPDESEERMEINVVPMIDVVFSILAFLIISGLYLTRLEGLPVSLPSASTSESQPRVSVTVTIEADGRIGVNRELVELWELEGKVRSHFRAD